MELNCLHFPPKISLSVPSLSCNLFYKSTFLQNPRCSLEKSLTFSTKRVVKAEFFGRSFDFGLKSGSLSDLRNTHVRFSPVRAVGKRRKELPFEEIKVRNEMEDLLVVKLRKLLMMSLGKRILLEKIDHLKNDLGLPLEFRSTICKMYPQYFRVLKTKGGPVLELTHWDPELAVSFAELEEEENRAREIEEKDMIIDRPPKFNRMKFYISPYKDFSHLRQGSAEKEKHACGVVHEILSLTIEKRTLVDHLTHFREEFRFSQRLRGMLIRHPDMFYVSLKGDRNSVFLREAYHDSHLVEKNKPLLIKEKLRSLVNVPRFPKRGASRDSNETEGGNEVEDGTGGEEDDDWSELDDDIASDGSEYDEVEADGDFEYEWSDEDDDDDMPPDFDEDEENLKPGSSKQSKEEKARIKMKGRFSFLHFHMEGHENAGKRGGLLL